MVQIGRLQMKSLAPILMVLIGVIGCDSEIPSELPQERAKTPSVSQLKEIADLESRLESEAKTNADIEIEFEQRKAEIEAKIAETVQKRDHLRKLQADHYAELAKEEAQEVERLTNSRGQVSLPRRRRRLGPMAMVLALLRDASVGPAPFSGVSLAALGPPAASFLRPSGTPLPRSMARSLDNLGPYGDQKISASDDPRRRLHEVHVPSVVVRAEALDYFGGAKGRTF